MAELRTQVELHSCAGAVWTQTTDVEGEVNGMLTYDRRILRTNVQQWRTDIQVSDLCSHPNVRVADLMAAICIPQSSCAVHANQYQALYDASARRLNDSIKHQHGPNIALVDQHSSNML